MIFFLKILCHSVTITLYDYLPLDFVLGHNKVEHFDHFLLQFVVKSLKIFCCLIYGWMFDDFFESLMLEDCSHLAGLGAWTYFRWIDNRKEQPYVSYLRAFHHLPRYYVNNEMWMHLKPAQKNSLKLLIMKLRDK